MQNYALFMKACINGLYTVVQEILQKQDIDVNLEWYNSTPLMAACSNGHNDIVKLLLEHKADSNYISSIHNTALMRAVSAGNLETVMLLLEYGADPNGYLMPECIHVKTSPKTRNDRLIHPHEFRANRKYTKHIAHAFRENSVLDNRYNTPLLRALYKGHSAIVECLLAHGANPEYKQGIQADLMQPILVAAQWYEASIRRALVKLLLEYKANPSITVYNHAKALLESAAFYAAEYNDEELLDMLIAYGLQCNISVTVGYHTPLHAAVVKNNKSMVKKLLDVGHFIDVQDNEGQTPLCHTQFVDKELACLLIEAGADKEHKENRYGQTPLCRALEYTMFTGVTTSVENALACGVDVNTQDKRGNSLIVYLLLLLDDPFYIREYHINAVELLIQAQADLELANNEGETALSLAQKHGINLWT